MSVPAKQATKGDILESVLIKGDISKLTPEERATYYLRVCDSIGLNPLTRPLEYITLSGRLTLYAKKDCTDQLRKLNGISIKIVSQDLLDDLLSVHVSATDQTGRTDEDVGVVTFPATLKGEARANTIMKGVTKAKRRVTLSISGLGFLDETEVDDIPLASRPPVARANVMLDAPDTPQTSAPAAASAAPAATSHPAGAAEDDSARIERLDRELGLAAEGGGASLKTVWDKIALDDRKVLVVALDRRHKPRAAEVDAGRQ